MILENMFYGSRGGGGDFTALVEGTITGVLESNVKTIAEYTFLKRTITEVILPECTRINGNAFYLCSDLTKATIPKVEILGGNVFNGCPNLTTVDTGALRQISNGCFINSGLTTLIIRGNTIPSLAGNAFNGTPIASGTGYIYVPESMVDDYKAASNWSTYAAQIRAIEE